MTSESAAGTVITMARQRTRAALRELRARVPMFPESVTQAAVVAAVAALAWLGVGR
jgi:hypothetical protein